jgi:hypothetical protein
MEDSDDLGQDLPTMLIEERVHTVQDFKHLYRKSMNNLKLYSSQYQDSDFKNDCHLIVGFIIDKQFQRSANVNFVRLASTNNLVERQRTIFYSYNPARRQRRPQNPSKTSSILRYLRRQVITSLYEVKTYPDFNFNSE